MDQNGLAKQYMSDLVAISVAIAGDISTLGQRLKHFENDILKFKKINFENFDFQNISMRKCLTDVAPSIVENVDNYVKKTIEEKKLDVNDLLKDEIFEHVILINRDSGNYQTANVPFVNLARLNVINVKQVGVNMLRDTLISYSKTCNSVIKNQTVEVYNLLSELAVKLQFVKQFAYGFSNQKFCGGEVKEDGTFEADEIVEVLERSYDPGTHQYDGMDFVEKPSGKKMYL